MSIEKIIFSSKAKSIENLMGTSLREFIKPFVYFNINEWRNNPNFYITQIRKIDEGTGFIVRSSSLTEDNVDSSNAGAYLSILNVDLDFIAEAIEKVISSYKNTTNQDEVLIQPMIKNVTKSGVGFSHDQNTGAPYRLINWHEGRDTSFVTSGMGGRLWVEPSKILKNKNKNEEFKTLRLIMNKMSKIFDAVPFDFEFAFSKEKNNEKFWLLQVRPLILNVNIESDKNQYNRIYTIWDALRRGMKRHPFLLGYKTLYGVMPDWNPAEIIGLRPKPLALSLYRDLVTENIWAYQRHNYGYRNLRSFPLIKHFFGLPYIDVRVSFNSFIPADIKNVLAEKLVNYYLSKLEKKEYLHDKIEFDIVFSCYTLDLKERLKSLNKFGFNKKDQKTLASSLLRITNNILNPKNGLWIKDYKKLKILQQRRIKITKSSQGFVSKIYWILEDAKRYGTLPFAGLARAAFISIQMLKSFVNIGIFTVDDYDNFLNSISTVSKELSIDLKSKTQDEIIKLYGHLRPGTYDITSPRYDENPNLFFNWQSKVTKLNVEKKFNLSLNQENKLNQLLKDNKLEFNAKELLKIMKSTIELREFAKFEFTKNLSYALVLIEEFGKKFNYSRIDMSYSSIDIIKELLVGSVDTKKLIKENIESGKEKYQETIRTLMPPLIKSPDDVWGFSSPDYQANFVTQRSITAKVGDIKIPSDLQNSIVCIPNADPGFDWIFSYSIGAIITAWGGANSHMSIRASELQIPAVIGVGEIKYKNLSTAKILHIDCANQLVKVVNK